MNDPGYQVVDGEAPAYIGWRKGAVYLPAGQLKVGDNQFQFTVKDATSSTPVAVKDLLLELKYDDSAPPAPAAAPTPTMIPITDTPPLPEQTPPPEQLLALNTPVETSDSIPQGVDFLPF